MSILNPAYFSNLPKHTQVFEEPTSRSGTNSTPEQRGAPEVNPVITVDKPEVRQTSFLWLCFLFWLHSFTKWFVFLLLTRGCSKCESQRQDEPAVPHAVDQWTGWCRRRTSKWIRESVSLFKLAVTHKWLICRRYLSWRYVEEPDVQIKDKCTYLDLNISLKILVHLPTVIHEIRQQRFKSKKKENWRLMLHRLSGLVVERPLWNWEVVGSIPSQFIPETINMGPIASLFGTQH